MELILGSAGYLLLMPYSGIAQYQYAILIILFGFAFWSLIVDLFCVYKMVKPLKVTLKTIILFVLSLKVIELITGFFKPILIWVLGSILYVTSQGHSSPSLEKLYSILLILLTTLIIALIKIIVARSYFTSLSLTRTIKWMLIASFIGFFLPHYVGSFYFKYLEEKHHEKVVRKNN